MLAARANRYTTLGEALVSNASTADVGGSGQALRFRSVADHVVELPKNQEFCDNRSGSTEEWTTEGIAGTGIQVRYIHGGRAEDAHWQVFAEYVGVDTSSSLALSATYVYGNYIDEALTVRRDLGTGPVFAGLPAIPTGNFVDFYFNQDDLFSTTSMAAGPNVIAAGALYPGSPQYQPGDIVESYDYGDFGHPRINGSWWMSSIGNSRMFTGRDWEPEIEFYYYRTRYMEPMWGRFTTRDWIGTWGALRNSGNPSALTAPNPHRFADPFGLKPFDPARDPVSPVPPAFKYGRSKNGQILPITHRDRELIRQAAQAACDKAQCALRTLESDPNGSKLTKKAHPDIDQQRLADQLREFLEKYCRGAESPNQFIIVPHTDNRDAEQRSRGWNYPDAWPDETYLPIDPRDGRLLYRDIPTDLIHEMFHYLFDTEDEGDPSNLQREIDDTIGMLCDFQFGKDGCGTTRPTRLKPDELAPGNR